MIGRIGEGQRATASRSPAVQRLCLRHHAGDLLRGIFGDIVRGDRLQTRLVPYSPVQAAQQVPTCDPCQWVSGTIRNHFTSKIASSLRDMNASQLPNLMSAR